VSLREESRGNSKSWANPEDGCSRKITPTKGEEIETSQWREETDNGEEGGEGKKITGKEEGGPHQETKTEKGGRSSNFRNPNCNK